MPEQLSLYPQATRQNLPDRPEPRTEQPAVRLERITKRYRHIHALRNVSLHIPRGEVFGLLGAKGAGKTTLVKLLLGFIRPDGGSIQLFGSPDLDRARVGIGYLPESPHYHRNFTGREYLRYHAELSGLRGRTARDLVERLIEAVGLGQFAGRLIRSYHRDMRARLGLAVALISAGGRPPELLILDEPASGLDREGRLVFRDIILECQRQGSTVLICSHQLSEIERTCTSVGILRAGRLITQTHLDESPRINILGVARNGAMDILPYLVPYLQNLHPAVIVRGGRTEDEPLMVSLPTGAGVPNSAAIKAAALKAVIDARWDIVSVYIENNDLESLYMMAVPPRGQPEGDRGDESQEEGTGMEGRGTGTTADERHITEPLAAPEPEQTQATGQAGQAGQQAGPTSEGTGDAGSSGGGGGRPTSPLAPAQGAEGGQPTDTTQRQAPAEVSPPPVAEAGAVHAADAQASWSQPPSDHEPAREQAQAYGPQHEQGHTLAEAATRKDA